MSAREKNGEKEKKQREEFSEDTTTGRERESLITSKNRVCSIGVEIVALRKRSLAIIRFAGEGVVGRLSCGEGEVEGMAKVG